MALPYLQIVGGLLLLCLGLFVQRADGPLGWMLVITGAALAAAGAMLIVLRSRMGP